MPPHNRPSSSRLSTATTPAHVKSRQFSHLNSQLAQLQAHLADLDNHVRITAIQAEAMKRLGAQHASMYLTPRPRRVLMEDLWLRRVLLESRGIWSWRNRWDKIRNLETRFVGNWETLRRDLG